MRGVRLTGPTSGISFDGVVTRFDDPETDPRQQNPIGSAAIEHRLKSGLIAAMKALGALEEAYRRCDLEVQA